MKMRSLPLLFAALLGACSFALAAEPERAPIRLGMIDGMSGPFANAGEAVARNLQLAVENVNARGGVRLADGMHPLQLDIFDNKQGVEESLIELRRLTDRGIPFVLQGNSSAVAAALVDAVERHNRRAGGRERVLFLNYSAVDPALTNAQCSFWHFRFDANADMRMHALTEVIRGDAQARRVYLIGQDYSFGRMVAEAARSQLAAKRPDIRIVGHELHPVGKIKDFAPYIAKIKASGADTVVTGNWGNDLTLLVKAARQFGLDAKFYTFYGNSLGAPAAIGEAGVDRVRAVAEWHPNAGGAQPGTASARFTEAFRARYPQPQDDYPMLRMHVMIEMLVRAIEQAGSTDAVAVARALEGARYRSDLHDAVMRAEDHQLIQPLYVSVMQRLRDGRIRFDNEGSGYGFRTEAYLPAMQTALPTTCRMQRPSR
ncbi:branched-chain amino acid ABC transporter substrate-binding protein [Oxalicibacterium flavum]|uniref:branched-chain amino acid ABC transporter substrate-binding protein n=1 Tax=Oxalicibacterium flavum TaxID=179467 RepID=UPI001666E12E|nr:branched-chain amino acid ABC transporter substrate-binding protein [Oxalicibacterium flavum]